MGDPIYDGVWGQEVLIMSFDGLLGPGSLGCQWGVLVDAHLVEGLSGCLRVSFSLVSRDPLSRSFCRKMLSEISRPF